jgi:triacylglycerol lipase
MSGFKNIGPLDYWYGIADALTKDGHDVHIAVMDPFNSSEVRGAQLETFVEQVLQQTGAAKVTLIGHSQGGFEIRYVAHQLGASKVSAVVSLAAPHRGDAVADVALGQLPGPAQDAIELFLNLYGVTLHNGMLDESSHAALYQVSSAGAAEFNQKYPDAPDVAYYSISGRSNNSRGEDSCATASAAPFVSRWDDQVDPVDPIFLARTAILEGSATPKPAHDGLVTVASAKWGTFLGCIPADHLDEVCQIAGDSPGPGNAFDCVLFHRQLADWLRSRGH